MWEVFSFGELPYGQLNNTQVCEVLIEQKHRLNKPRACDDRVYQIMMECWAEVSFIMLNTMTSVMW